MPIKYEIARKNFELIGDQLGAIIKLEVFTQADTYGVTECRGVEVYRERNTPPDHTEMSVINIQYAATELDNKHQGSSDGANTFFVDIFCNAKSRTNEDGDHASNLKLQRLMGIVWEILENPIYKHLELTPPSLSNVMVSDMEIINTKEDNDANNTTFGRITYKVKCNEKTMRLPGESLTSAITQVKLVETEKGYRYEYLDA